MIIYSIQKEKNLKNSNTQKKIVLLNYKNDELKGRKYIKKNYKNSSIFKPK